jgi:hypothetical protein
MHHTTPQASSPRFNSIARRLSAHGLPVVALSALGLAFGCAMDDMATQQRSGAEQPAADAPAGAMMSTPDGVAHTNEGNLGPIEIAGGTPAAFVEDNGADCEIGALPNPADLQVLQTLPDPFLGLNGERLGSKAQWRCRREEIRKVAERFIYGEKPPKPESVTGTVTATDITVNVQNQGLTATFTAKITMPAGATGPVPAVIGYGGSSFQNTILDAGAAFINYSLAMVGDETTRNPKVGAFYTVNPDHPDTGMLVAWAWGVSRMIDLIESSGSELIDPKGIGVHGCSRSGKGAFIAGAFDERVALTIPMESGMSGVPAFRMIVPEGGEVLRNAIEYRPWAGDAFQQFLVLGAPQTDPAALDAQNQQSGQLQFKLPIDTHEVIGMVAPRGLFVMGNPFIVNLAPKAEDITVQAGAEIYAALGVKENLTYVSNIADGTHCSFRPEFVAPLQANIQKFLKHDASATTGQIDPEASVAGELGPNIAWTTPTLQ